MELVHYFRVWLEGAGKQTDRTDGLRVQSTFGAKAEQVIEKKFERTLNVLEECFAFWGEVK